MNNLPQNSHERGNRKKDIADTVQDVLKNNADEHQLLACLHRSFSQLEKSSFAERQSIQDILASNVILAKACLQLRTEVKNLNEKVERLEQKAF